MIWMKARFPEWSTDLGITAWLRFKHWLILIRPLGISTFEALNHTDPMRKVQTTLEWVAKRSGKTTAIWPVKNSTKTSSKHGFKAEGGLAPEVREWNCLSCPTYHLRDENAASYSLKCVFSQNKFPCSGLLTVHVNERSALRMPLWGGLCKSPQINWGLTFIIFPQGVGSPRDTSGNPLAWSLKNRNNSSVALRFPCPLVNQVCPPAGRLHCT